jgi:hypothetical protein
MNKNKNIILLLSLLMSVNLYSATHKFVINYEFFNKIVVVAYEGNEGDEENINNPPFEENQNSEWAIYLSNKNCWNDPLEIFENSVLSCTSLLINPLDSGYPLGNIGLSTLNAFDFSNNDIKDVNFLSTVSTFNSDFLLNNNIDLNNINGLSQVTNIQGNLNLTNTAISDYSALRNLTLVKSNLILDPIEGNEIFPIDGSWCDNEVYYEITDEATKEYAALECNNQYIEKNNEDWAIYLYGKRQSASSQRCSSSPTSIDENVSLVTCFNVGIDPSDANYPDGTIGVESYTNINMAHNELVDLNLFKGVKTISGYLYLYGNTSLTNVDGLSSLTSVGGNLNLYENPSLNNISGLSSLTSVGGSLAFSTTDVIDYSALSNLGSVGSTIYIDALTGGEAFPTSGAWCTNETYHKFNKSEPMLSAAESCGNSTDNNNANWAKYLYNKRPSGSGLSSRCSPSATSIPENFNASGSCSGASINPSDDNYPYGSIGIENYSNINMRNNQLVDLNLFKGAKTVSGYLNLYENTSLSDISGLSSLTSVGGYLSFNITDVMDYSALSNLGFVFGNINIDVLTGGEAFPTSGAWCTNKTYHNFTTTEPMLIAAESCGNSTDSTVSNNANWAKYLYNKGTSSSRCSSSPTSIDENVSLSNCSNDGINPSDNNYPYGSIGVENYSNIRMASNQLVDLNLFAGIKTVSDYLYLQENTSLNDISGLSSLTSVGGRLYLSYNPSLSDISGLSSLTSVGSHFNLNETAIIDYSALSNLGSVGGSINFDTLTGGESFPTSGAWCTNKTYDKISSPGVLSQARSSCGD